MRRITFIPFFCLVIVFAPIAGAGAAYTPDTFYTEPHAAPAWFEPDGIGGFYGETTDGTPFTQTLVLPDSGVRLQRFAIGLVYFYVSDRGIINAESDLTALSIYLALA
jgi:hypothetical protein